MEGFRSIAEESFKLYVITAYKNKLINLYPIPIPQLENETSYRKTDKVC